MAEAGLQERLMLKDEYGQRMMNGALWRSECGRWWQIGMLRGFGYIAQQQYWSIHAIGSVTAALPNKCSLELREYRRCP